VAIVTVAARRAVLGGTAPGLSRRRRAARRGSRFSQVRIGARGAARRLSGRYMAAAGASGLYVNPNTGDTQAGLAPFRNAIINGDMRINQRGTSTNLASLSTVVAASPGSFVTDRWNVFRGSYVAGAVIGQGTDLTTSDLPFSEAGIKTFGRIGRLSGNALTNSINFHYNMESQDCDRFIGKKITVSFYYRIGSNFSGTSIGFEILTGTGTDQGLRNGITGAVIAGSSGSLSLNTAWQRRSVTCTLGSNINQIFLSIAYAPTGTAGAADYFDITGVQLELGSVATPFEVRPYSLEMLLCIRYYQIVPAGVFAGNTNGSGAFSIIRILFPQMRSTPTIANNPINIEISGYGSINYTLTPGTPSIISQNLSGTWGTIYGGALLTTTNIQLVAEL